MGSSLSTSHLYLLSNTLSPRIELVHGPTYPHTPQFLSLHHLSLGLISISITPTLHLHLQVYNHSWSCSIDFLQHTSTEWHTQLSTYLTTLGSSSIASTHHLLLSSHPHLSSTYPTHLSIFCHHQWIGSLLTLESSAHTSIQSLSSAKRSLSTILQHHHTIITHLTWLNISLSSHTLTPYLHNNTYNTLGRAEDIFHDNSTHLYPLPNTLCCQEIGTADFLVDHIHGFSLHLTVLIMLKAISHTRTSRLISDKLDLGFHYPCDGPARGGTCQISPWDHLFLSPSWMYNLLDVLLFHYFWKMQSDI